MGFRDGASGNASSPRDSNFFFSAFSIVRVTGHLISAQLHPGNHLRGHLPPRLGLGFRVTVGYG